MGKHLHPFRSRQRDILKHLNDSICNLRLNSINLSHIPILNSSKRNNSLIRKVNQQLLLRPPRPALRHSQVVKDTDLLEHVRSCWT